jgi:hypothetical protein
LRFEREKVKRPPPRYRFGVSMGATLTEISKRWRVPVYITLYAPVCANQCILAPNARIAFSALIARRHYYYFQTNLVISQLVKKKLGSYRLIVMHISS